MSKRAMHSDEGRERSLGMRIKLMRGGLLVVALLLPLVLAEIVLRASYREPPPPRKPVQDESLPKLEGIVALLQRNQEGIFKGVVHRTNSLGVRGPEYPRKAEPGVFRVAVTGDSVTMGWAIPETLAYPARLEERLNADPPASLNRSVVDRIEVFNLGIAGLNAVSAVARLKMYHNTYDFDLMVYGFTVNDIEGAKYRSTLDRDELAELQRRRKRFARSPSMLLKRTWPNLVNLIDAVLGRPDPVIDELQLNYFENPAAWAKFETALDRLEKMGRRRPVCVSVFIHTNLGELGWLHPFHPFYDRVSEAARARRLTVIPSYPAFRGQTGRNLWVSFMDPHPNQEGHEILAGALDEGLRELPKVCWRKKR
jgi:lysophospholipase L1-like esterase